MACHSIPFTVCPLAISKAEFFQDTRLQVRNREGTLQFGGDIRELPSQTHKATSTIKKQLIPSKNKGAPGAAEKGIPVPAGWLMEPCLIY